MGCSSSKEVDSNEPPSKLSKPSTGPAHNGDLQIQVVHLKTDQMETGHVQGNEYSTIAPGVWPKIIQRVGLPFIVHIQRHTLSSPPLGNYPCWTYISQGLSKVRQPEVVFTLLRRGDESEESFPEGPIEWMKVVYGLASSGLNLETGQMCDLVFEDNRVQVKMNQFAIVQEEPSKWMSLRRFGALLHGIPISNSVFGFPEGILPESAHHVIALTHEEAAVARQFGPTRVIGHVGVSIRWFPYPPWVDRDREDCVTMADQKATVRIGLPVARMYGFNAMLVGEEIVFTVPEGDEKREAFKKFVLDAPLSAGLSFDSFMVSEADSGLIWKTGQQDARCYAADCGSMARLNLAFITFAPQQTKNYSIMVEDGYGILITDNTWKSIRDAIKNTQDIVIDLEKGKCFRLVWKKTIYHNPIDGKEYRASWTTYPREGHQPLSDSHVQLGELISLVEPPDGHVNVDELVAYIQKIVEALEKSIPAIPIATQEGSKSGRQLIIEIELPKREGWLKFSAYPSMDDLPSGQILPQLAALKAPQALSLIRFQLVINVWGYDGPSAYFS